MGRVVCVSGRHSLFFRFLTIIIIIDIPRVTLPAIDVAGLLGCRRSAVVAAGAPFFLFHETASQKREKNLRKISRLPPPPRLGEKLLALRPQCVLPLYTAYLMNNHCRPPLLPGPGRWGRGQRTLSGLIQAKLTSSFVA